MGQERSLENRGSASGRDRRYVDDEGIEARRFGVSTSGQTLLYDKAGALLFSGGITGARAHQGDNDGRRSIVALLNRKTPGRTATNVFGCSLFSDGL